MLGKRPKVDQRLIITLSESAQTLRMARAALSDLSNSLAALPIQRRPKAQVIQRLDKAQAELAQAALLLDNEVRDEVERK